MKTIVLNTLEGGAVSEQIGTLIKGDEVEVLNTTFAAVQEGHFIRTKQFFSFFS